MVLPPGLNEDQYKRIFKSQDRGWIICLITLIICCLGGIIAMFYA